MSIILYKNDPLVYDNANEPISLDKLLAANKLSTTECLKIRAYFSEVFMNEPLEIFNLSISLL